MNRNVSKPISRRGVLFSALGVCALAAGPKRSYALGNGESDNFMDVDFFLQRHIFDPLMNREPAGIDMSSAQTESANSPEAIPHMNSRRQAAPQPKKTSEVSHGFFETSRSGLEINYSATSGLPSSELEIL